MHWKNVVKENTIMEMKGMKYKMLGTLIAVAKNGGFIAITLDKTKSLPLTDANLKNNIVIHNNRGTLISSLQIFDTVIAMDFVENQQLVIIMQNGTYFYYNPQTEALGNKLALANSEQFASEDIIGAKIVSNHLIYISARTSSVYMQELTPAAKRVLLYQHQGEIGYDACNFVVVPAGDVSPLQVFIPFSRLGVMRLQLLEGEVKKDMVFENLKEEILALSVSPSCLNLAVLTRDSLLTVISTKLIQNKWTKNIELSEGDFASLKQLEWVSYHAVAFVFEKIVKYVSCGVKEDYYPVAGDEAARFGRTGFIIAKSEIDGLRLIRIFDGKDVQNCSYVRRLPQSYRNVTGNDISLPGYLLFEQYAALKENHIFEGKDIRANKRQLLEGVSDLIECACFEFNAVVDWLTRKNSRSTCRQPSSGAAS